MRKSIKKILSLLTIVAMLTGLSLTAYAMKPAEFMDSDRLDINDISDFQDLFQENEDLKIELVDAQNFGGSITRGNPGEGPAKPVSSVRITKVGALNVSGREGNVGVIVEVIGHGHDRATYDGRSVVHFDYSPIILYGTTVDGWYYIYDCGKPTLGTHDFEVILRSTNSPYNEVKASAQITIGLQN